MSPEYGSDQQVLFDDKPPQRPAGDTVRLTANATEQPPQISQPSTDHGHVAQQTPAAVEIKQSPAQELSRATTGVAATVDGADATSIASDETEPVDVFAAALGDDEETSQPPPPPTAVVDVEYPPATSDPFADQQAGPANDSGVAVEPPPPAQLTGADIATALRHLSSWHLPELLARREARQSGSPIGIGGWRRARERNEPDIGAQEAVDYDAKGLRIEITSQHETRTGHLTWGRLRKWLYCGVSPLPLQVALNAHAAMRRLDGSSAGYLAIGEAALARAAREELTGYLDRAADTILTTAQAAHEPGPAGQKRQPAAAGDCVLTDDVLARITALASVFPTEATQHKPVSELQLGDVVLHAGYGGRPMRLTEPLVVRDSSFELVGEWLDPRPADGPVTWQYHRSGDAEPTVRTVRLPNSLAPLINLDNNGTAEPLETTGASPATPPQHRPSGGMAADEPEPANPPPNPAPSEPADAEPQLALWETDAPSEPTARQPDVPTPRPQPVHPEPTVTATRDPYNQHWANFVAQAAEYGFAVHTHYAGDTEADADARTIRIAHDQPALTRLVQLAQHVAVIAMQQAQVETAPPHPAPVHHRTATEVHPAGLRPEPTAAGSDTPIYDALQRGSAIQVVAAPAAPTSVYDSLVQDLGIPDPLAAYRAANRAPSLRTRLAGAAPSTRPTREAGVATPASYLDTEPAPLNRRHPPDPAGRVRSRGA